MVRLAHHERLALMGDRILKWVAHSVAWFFVAMVVALGGMLLWQSLPAFQAMGFSFLTSSTWDPVLPQFGILPFVYGTVVSSLIALLVGAPVGIGIAIFLTELTPGRFSSTIGFMVELLAAIPSVILGLWGLLYVVPYLRLHLEPLMIATLGWCPLFSGPPYGVGLFAAGLILSIMVVPIIAAISRDVLRAVPREQREAAVSLGATRWEMIRIAVLTYAKSGIVGAVFLGLGRAIGETMAVTMVIGNRPEIARSLFAPAHTMASVIANEFTEATSDLYISALIAVGFVLFVLTCVINGLARFLVTRTRRRMEA